MSSKRRDSSSSDSSSSSSSDSSSDDEHSRRRRKHQHIKATAARATAPNAGCAPVAAVAAPAPASLSKSLAAAKHSLAVQFAPALKAPAPRVDPMTAGAAGTLAANITPDTVTYRINIDVPLSELKLQPDGGHVLELAVGRGLDSQVEFSNKAHAPGAMSAHGDVDFVTGADLCMDHHTIPSPLIVTGPVRATKGEAVLDLRSRGADAPYGRIGHLVPLAAAAGGSNNSVSFRRIVTVGKLQFISTYPGQTAENVANGVKFFENDALVNAKEPQSAVAHFYNAMINQAGKPEDMLISEKSAKIDAKNRVYADKAIALEALKQATDSIDAHIAYSNVTDPAKVKLTIALPAKNMLRAGKTEAMHAPLLYAFKNGASYAAAVDKFGAKAADERIMANPETTYHLSGTYSVHYLKVTPDFRLEPASDE